MTLVEYYKDVHFHPLYSFAIIFHHFTPSFTHSLTQTRTCSLLPLLTLSHSLFFCCFLRVPHTFIMIPALFLLFQVTTMRVCLQPAFGRKPIASVLKQTSFQHRNRFIVNERAWGKFQTPISCSPCSGCWSLGATRFSFKTPLTNLEGKGLPVEQGRLYALSPSFPKSSDVRNVNSWRLRAGTETSTTC